MRSSKDEDDLPLLSVTSSLDAEISEISDDEEDLYGEAEAYQSQDGTTVQDMAGNPGQQLLTRMDGERVVKLTTSGFRPVPPQRHTLRATPPWRQPRRKS
jgi:hypothetical protein